MPWLLPVHPRAHSHAYEAAGAGEGCICQQQQPNLTPSPTCSATTTESFLSVGKWCGTEAEFVSFKAKQKSSFLAQPFARRLQHSPASQKAITLRARAPLLAACPLPMQDTLVLVYRPAGAWPCSGPEARPPTRAAVLAVQCLVPHVCIVPFPPSASQTRGMREVL